MPRQVPRVRATPRQIRDIKPKRQLPRSQASDHADEWWQEANETNTTADASNNSLENSNGAAAALHQDPDARGKIEKIQSTCSNWYYQTARMKKLKQLFWTFILYRTLKLIYFMDLDNYTSSKWETSLSSGYYGSQYYSNDRPESKSFFSKDDLTEASLYSPKSSLYGSDSNLRGASSSAVMKVTEPDYITGPYYSKSNTKSMLGLDSSSRSLKSDPLGGAKRVMQSIVGSSDKKSLQQQLDFGDAYSLGGPNSLVGYTFQSNSQTDYD